MSFPKATHTLVLVTVFCIGAKTAAAQGYPAPAEQQGRLILYEALEGSANSEGQAMTLTSSASYNFNQHFRAGLGIPIYFNHTSSSTATTTNTGIGNFFAMLGGTWKNPRLNYATTLTGSAPTGDKSKGLSTGHATFDWNNRFDHDFSRFTPFADAGVGNSVPDTRFFLRPFASFGTLAHFEAGTDVDMSHTISLTLSAYDVAPWGSQTIFSRFVNSGSTGSGGGHGRVFETRHETTGGASLTRDNGFTAGVSASPAPYLDFELGYTRSVHFALNTVSFGVGVNLSKLFGGRTRSVR